MEHNRGMTVTLTHHLQHHREVAALAVPTLRALHHLRPLAILIALLAYQLQRRLTQEHQDRAYPTQEDLAVPVAHLPHPDYSYVALNTTLLLK
jgi:hypothetical protein